jgi:hypothetical protein
VTNKISATTNRGGPRPHHTGPGHGELSASGLLAVTVPAEHCGADVGALTLAEIFRLLAAADASLAQIPQSHFAYVNVIRRQGDAEQRKFELARVPGPIPEVYFGGSSPIAREVAAKYIDDYLTWGEPPAQVTKKMALDSRARGEGRADAALR